MVEAVAVPEVRRTIDGALVIQAGLSACETVRLHGGSSGIDTPCIQLAARVGAVVTVGSEEKAEARRALGAGLAINYREEEDGRRC